MLKDSYIGDSEAKLIAEVFERKDYEYIRLGGIINLVYDFKKKWGNTHIDNRIGPEGMKILVEPLKNNFSLCSLYLGGKYFFFP